VGCVIAWLAGQVVVYTAQEQNTPRNSHLCWFVCAFVFFDMADTAVKPVYKNIQSVPDPAFWQERVEKFEKILAAQPKSTIA
jgi:hypothetical protein